MTCIECGATLLGRQTKFCSRRCSIDGYGHRRVADGRIKAMRDRDKEKNAAYFAEYRKTYIQPRESKTCAGCGEAFDCRRGEKSKSGPQRYCSTFCGRLFRAPETYARGPRARRSLLARKAARAARGSRGTSIWFSGNCAGCDAWFIARSRAGMPPKFCSDRCKHADAAHRHRARKRGARVESIYRRKIFERDNWVCHICGDPVNREAKNGDLDYPTLDHIIPLARGGAHSMANLKPAHAWCNSVKRDVDLALIH